MNKKILIVLVLLFASALTGCVTEEEELTIEEIVEISEHQSKPTKNPECIVYDNGTPITSLIIDREYVTFNGYSIAYIGPTGIDLFMIPDNLQERIKLNPRAYSGNRDDCKGSAIFLHKDNVKMVWSVLLKNWYFNEHLHTSYGNCLSESEGCYDVIDYKVHVVRGDGWLDETLSAYNNGEQLESLVLGTPLGINDKAYEHKDVTVIIIPDGFNEKIFTGDRYEKHFYNESIIVGDNLIGTENRYTGILFVNEDVADKMTFDYNVIENELFENDFGYYPATNSSKSCYCECDGIMTCLINCEECIAG